jgi:hypothetical protein
MKVAVRAHQTATSWQVRMSETRLSCPMRPASAHLRSMTWMPRGCGSS